MNLSPVQQFKTLVQKNKIEDAEIMCKCTRFDEEEEWYANIPFNPLFSNCLGIASTKAKAKEITARLALPILSSGDYVAQIKYDNFIDLVIVGGRKIPGKKNRTPFICVPKLKISFETCAATAFNVHDAIERCKQNLDTLFSSHDQNAPIIDRLEDLFSEDDEDEKRR